MSIINKGIVFGAYDLLHPGHLYSFEYAKKFCDYLIVGLHTDPSKERPKEKNKPVQTTFERYYQLKSCKNVNEIIPYDTEDDLLHIMKLVVPEHRFLGADYTNLIFTDKEYCEYAGIYIHYIPRDHQYSSTELRGRING